MEYAFPSRLSKHIRDGRWTEQQLRAMGVVIIEFVLTLPLDKKAEDVCARCLAALRSGDEAELCAATNYAAAHAANATYAVINATYVATANATAAAYVVANATAAAAYAAYAAAATAAAAAAARAALRCSTSGKARIRKNFNFMVAQIALIVG